MHRRYGHGQGYSSQRRIQGKRGASRNRHYQGMSSRGLPPSYEAPYMAPPPSFQKRPSPVPFENQIYHPFLTPTDQIDEWFGEASPLISLQPGAEAGQPYQAQTGNLSRKQEMDSLGGQANFLREQIEVIEKRIDGLRNIIEQKRRTKQGYTAYVYAHICNGCGICSNVCPEGAITIHESAEIDESKCTGCGVCAGQCPQRAISMKLQK